MLVGETSEFLDLESISPLFQLTMIKLRWRESYEKSVSGGIDEGDSITRPVESRRARPVRSRRARPTELKGAMMRFFVFPFST